MMMETPANIISPPLLLRNLFLSLYIYVDKFILYFIGNYKLLKFIRKVLLQSFLFFLRVLPSLFPPLNLEEQRHPLDLTETDTFVVPPCNDNKDNSSNKISGLGVSRALSQVLTILNNIPVTSRKYEAVRALAESLIEENYKVGNKALRDVNRAVLSTAFARTLEQLEFVVEEQSTGFDGYYGGDSDGTKQIVKAMKVAWNRVGRMRKRLTRLGNSAEKLAAELLWLAQQLAACGCAEEAVGRWASASNLARLSVVAEPRMQGSLLKVSAFLFKQARDLGKDEAEESRKEQERQMKMNMLMSWLPLLCRANNGTDAPVLTISERAELEKILEETIDVLDLEGQQEKVLYLWLHHYMYCQSSDWPNLQPSFIRWFRASRQLVTSKDNEQNGEISSQA